VLARLARAGLGLPDVSAATVPLGEVQLLPHQEEAVHRLRPLLTTHGGALLADAVGLGKTFVALALVREWPAVLVIAPATLLPMWRSAITRTECTDRVRLVSLHAYSRPIAPEAFVTTTLGAPRLVIVDEAHHLRNPNTQRYRHVATACRGAHVLLLSASPIYNRLADLAHLFALFLGARALALDTHALQRLTVRRTADSLPTRSERWFADTRQQVAAQRTADALPVHGAHHTAHAPRAAPATPHVVVHPPLSVPDAPSVTRLLARLPPPLPTRDGQAAGALIALGLVRAWCSSVAAARAHVQTRRLRAAALDAILRDGRWPSTAELRSWSVGDDAVQLGFTALLVAEPEERAAPAAARALREAQRTLARHLDALDGLTRALHAVAAPLDRARVEVLRAIRAQHRDVPLVAFSQYASTVRALGTLMRWEQGVATLTARGGRVAGGPLSRQELLQRFAPRAHGAQPPPPHERIRVLLATDLLSEGVNLQDAGVIVHLDLPWTPAAISQREGRLARLGSPHETVHAFTIAPPGGGAALLAMAHRLRHKARIAFRVLEPGEPDARPAASVSAPVHAPPSSVARVLAGWQAHAHDERPDPFVLIAVRYTAPQGASGSAGTRAVRHHGGWLAAIHHGDQPQLVGGWFSAGRRSTRVQHEAASLRELLRCVPAPDCEPHAPARSDARAIADAQTRVLRALARRARADNTRQLVEVLHAPGPRAERVLRTLLASAPLAARARLAPAIHDARLAVRSLRGAGDEQALATLLDNAPTLDGSVGALAAVSSWLHALATMARANRPEVPDTNPQPLATHTVRALLLLLP
jgi:superfamily II DNA or RNA helicase